MTERIGTAVLELRTDSQPFTTGLTKAEQALKGLGGHMDDAGKQAGTMSRVLSTAAGAFAGFISAQAVMRGVSAAFSFAKEAVFGMNATLETSTLQFTTLMGDADLAREHVRGLFEFAKKTPFETGPIIEASRMMRTFGGDALDTQDNLLLLGNASAATGAPINELGFWVGRLFSQLQGGKPFGEAAMRLQELAVLSPQTRTRMEELQQAGAGASEIFGILQEDLGKFTGAMEAQAGTWSGVTSTFKDTIELLLADSFKPFFDVVRDGLGLINEAMGSQGVEQTLASFKASVQGAFGTDSRQTVLSLAEGLLSFADTAIGMAQGVYQTFQFLRTGIIGVAAVVLELITTVSEASLKALEFAAALDPTGKLEQFAQRGRETTAFMRTLTNEFHNAREGAHQAALGNDAFGRSMDGVQDVLRSTRANLQQVTQASEAQAVATTGSAEAARQAAAALAGGGGLTPTTKEQQKAAERAAEAQAKFDESVRALTFTLRSQVDLFAAAAPHIQSAQDSLGAYNLIAIQGTEAVLAHNEQLRQQTEKLARLGMIAPTVALEVDNVTAALQRAAETARTGAGAFSGFFGGLVSGFQNLMQGMTGGQGIGGFMNNLGKGIVDGLGSIVSGGLSSVISMATNLAMQGLSKLGGWIKGVFGFGPSAAEREGNAAADAFRASLSTVLTDAQRLEAQVAVNQGANRAWVESTIAIRDAYLLVGRSEEEALAAADKLHKAQQSGGEAVNAVLQEVSKTLTEGYVPAGQEASALAALGWQGTIDLIKEAQEETGEQARELDDLAARGRGSFGQLTNAIDIMQAKLGNTESLDTLEAELKKAADGGTYDLGRILSEVESLHASLGDDTGVQALMDALAEAAETGVMDFATMSDAIGKLKETMALPITIPVGLVFDPDLYRGALFRNSSSSNDSGSSIDFTTFNDADKAFWLSQNPNDQHRMDEALNLSLVEDLKRAGISEAIAKEFLADNGGDLARMRAAFDIPQFGSGGLVTRPLIGQIAESGPEVIYPLDRFEQMWARRGDGEQPIVVRLEVDGITLAERMVRHMPRALSHAGLA